MAARRSISIWFRVTFTASKHFSPLLCSTLQIYSSFTGIFVCFKDIIHDRNRRALCVFL
jgi:hypothetical protein